MLHSTLKMVIIGAAIIFVLYVAVILAFILYTAIQVVRAIMENRQWHKHKKQDRH